jgi:hypothetical protein
VPEQLGEQQRVDVAAGQDHDHRRLERPGVLQQRRDPRRPGRLDDLLRPLEAEQQAARQALLGYRDNPAGQAGQDPERQLAGPAHGDAVRHRGRGFHRDRLARGQRAGVRRGRSGLHARDLHRRVQIGDGHGDSGRQAAAADGNDDRADLRALLDDLEAERALAGDDVRVLERVDQDAPGTLRVLLRAGQRLLDVGAAQQDLRAVATRRLLLRQRGALGHEHGRPGAQQPGRERNALRVVARAGRHDAPGALGVGEPGDPQVRPADLERAGPLQVLALEVDGAVEKFRQHTGTQHGGLRDDAPDEFPRGHHVVALHGTGHRCHASSLPQPGTGSAPGQINLARVRMRGPPAAT